MMGDSFRILNLVPPSKGIALLSILAKSRPSIKSFFPKSIFRAAPLRRQDFPFGICSLRIKHLAFDRLERLKEENF